jgi:hypothetical protein
MEHLSIVHCSSCIIISNLYCYDRALATHHCCSIHFLIIQMPEPQAWICVEKYYGPSNENELNKL